MSSNKYIYSLAAGKFKTNSSSGTATASAKTIAEEKDLKKYEENIKRNSEKASSVALKKLYDLTEIKRITEANYTVDTNTTPPTDDTEIRNLGIQAYLYAFSFIENNNFLTRTKLDPTDENYLKLNAFNYSFTPSPLIISPDYNVYYAPCIMDFTPLKGTNSSYTLNLPEAIKLNRRYYVCQFVDMFTNNFYYITPKTNTSFQTKFQLVAPDYTGKTSETIVKMNSWFVLILLRVAVDLRVPNDNIAAAFFEKGFTLDVPVDIKPETIALPDTSKLPIKSADLDINLYYNALNKIWKFQEVFTKQDIFYLREFQKLGLFRDEKAFSLSTFPYIPVDKAVAKETSLFAQTEITRIINTPAPVSTNYWGTSANAVDTSGPLRYGDKALIAWQYIYANNKDEAIYFSCYVDSTNTPLNGSNTYTLDFPSIPPINQPGFWSITAYNLEGYVVPSPNQKIFTTGQNIRDPCQITLSSKPPSDDTNPFYLQTPANTTIYLLLRLYNTTSDSINYIPPLVVKQ
jgi:hypothetical protein